MSSKRTGAMGALIAFTLIVAAVLGAAFITPPAQTAAGTVHTRTTLYGAYTRAIIVPSNSNAMTMTVKCVWKNSES